MIHQEYLDCSSSIRWQTVSLIHTFDVHNLAVPLKELDFIQPLSLPFALFSIHFPPTYQICLF